MNAVTWLHLSDWHQKAADFDRKIVRDALLTDLRQRAKISTSVKSIDFAIFSGDLAFSGKDSEYKTAEAEFLTRILEAVGVDRSRLFIVPGNHDLNREELELLSPLCNLFRERKKVSEILNNVDRRSVIFHPMQAYSRFVKSFLGPNRYPDPTFSSVSTFKRKR